MLSRLNLSVVSLGSVKQNGSCTVHIASCTESIETVGHCLVLGREIEYDCPVGL